MYINYRQADGVVGVGTDHMKFDSDIFDCLLLRLLLLYGTFFFIVTKSDACERQRVVVHTHTRRVWALLT